jgi:hypothetical protein
VEVEVAVRESLRWQENEIATKRLCAKIGEIRGRVRELCQKKMSYALE